MQKQRQRQIFPDIVREITIILMVFGHNIQFGSGGRWYGDELYFENILFSIIYSFHMPLLMLISGYFFYNSIKKYNFKELIINRITSLLIPILSWALIRYVLTICKAIVTNSINLSKILSYFNYAIYDLWFLWAVLILSLLVLFVNKYLKNLLILYVLLLIFMLFLPSKLNCYMYAYMLPYFIFGYAWNKYNLYEKCYKVFEKYKISIIFTVAVTYIILMLFYNKESYIYTSKICILGTNTFRQLGIDIYRWIVGFIGSFLVILSTYLVYNSFKIKSDSQGVFQKIIIICGKNTLGIYAINSFLNRAIIKVTEQFKPSIIIWVLETIIVLFICLVCNKILKNISLSRKLLLGGRS